MGSQKGTCPRYVYNMCSVDNNTVIVKVVTVLEEIEKDNSDLT